MRITICLLKSLLFVCAAVAQAPAEVPVSKISPVKSTIKFAVKASVPIEGTFQKFRSVMLLMEILSADAFPRPLILLGGAGTPLRKRKLCPKKFAISGVHPRFSVQVLSN